MTPDQIKSLRIALDMTISQFADALCFTGRNKHISVYRLEKGTRTPSNRTLAMLNVLVQTCDAKQLRLSPPIMVESVLCWCLACDPKHGEIGLECKRNK